MVMQGFRNRFEDADDTSFAGSLKRHHRSAPHHYAQASLVPGSGESGSQIGKRVEFRPSRSDGGTRFTLALYSDPIFSHFFFRLKKTPPKRGSIKHLQTGSINSADPLCRLAIALDGLRLRL
jgi:hypothetical protein